MNFHSFLRVNQIITYAAMSSVIIIAMVMYYIMGNSTYTHEDFVTGEILLMVNGAVLALSFVASRILKTKIIDSTKSQKLSKRLLAYRLHHLISIALYEMTGFLAAMFMFISGRIEFLLFALAALMFIFINFPNRIRVQTALNMNYNDLIEELD